METTAIVTAIFTAIGLIYSAIKIAHDKGPLRRFERLAATREQLEPGSRILKFTDQALLSLARDIACKESGESNIRKLEMFFVSVMVIGTLGVVVAAELSKNEDIPDWIINFLFINGAVFFVVSALGSLAIMGTRLIMYLSSWRFRKARRKIKRSRARQANAKRQEVRHRSEARRRAQAKRPLNRVVFDGG